MLCPVIGTSTGCGRRIACDCGNLCRSTDNRTSVATSGSLKPRNRIVIGRKNAFLGEIGFLHVTGQTSPRRRCFARVSRPLENKLDWFPKTPASTPNHPSRIENNPFLIIRRYLSDPFSTLRSHGHSLAYGPPVPVA